MKNIFSQPRFYHEKKNHNFDTLDTIIDASFLVNTIGTREETEELQSLQTLSSKHGVLQGGCVWPPLSPVSAAQSRVILNKHPSSQPQKSMKA